MEEHDDSAPSSLLGYDAAQLYLGGVSRATVKTLFNARLIQGVKLRGRTLFTKSSLDSYIGSLVRAAGPMRRTGRPRSSAKSANG